MSEESLWEAEEKQNPLTEEELWAQDERGSIEKGVDAVVGAAGAAADWVTGANVEPEIPKLSDIGLDRLATSTAGKSKIMGVLASSSDDNRIKKAFTEAIPDAQFQQDKFGNLVVIAPTSRNDQSQPLTWQRFYPNPQGADMATAYNVSSIASLAVPIQKFVGGVGWTAAALTGGIEGGVLEAFSSYLARDKYDVMEVPKNTLGGIIAKPFGDLLGAAFNKVKEIVNKARLGDMPTGAAEQEIAGALAEEGLNPSDVLESIYREMNVDISAGVNPAEAARYRTAQGLLPPVPMTRGDVSNDRSRGLLEDSILSGNYGDSARSQMEGIRADQNVAIEQNLGNIQQQMAGPEGQVIDQRVGGAQAQTELVASKAAQAAARDAAYTAARGSEAFIDPENGSQIAGTILENVNTNFSDINAPLAYRLFNEKLAPLLQEGQSLRSIFEARQLLTKHANQAGPEGAAAAAMNRQLDQQLIDQSNDLLLYGDSDAVGTWLDAIGQHKDFMKKWEDNGILKELTSEGIRDGEMVLNKDPTDVANAIFSVALNPNKTGMTRNLITLKKELSPEVWNGLRQEFYIKLSEKMMKTNGELSGQTFATAWKAVKANKTLVNTLFTQEERASIDALASTAMRISSKAANYSNSANSLLNALKGLMNTFGKTPASRAAGSLPVVSQAMTATAKGAMAQSPIPKKPSAMRQWLTTTGAVTIGAETVEGTANALLGNSAPSGENK
tara:strand:+ start:721 stop:2904 length:2184 start_codon:yes stop_codon:yes gene_type:complete